VTPSGALPEAAGEALAAGGREQRARRRWVAPMAGSYALDALFLAFFAATGAVAPAVPLAYAAAAALVSVVAWTAYARGWNLRLPGPDMVEPLVLLGVAMQLAVVYAAPQIAFPWLANLFTVFAFGMVGMSVRASVRIWTFEVLAMGLVLLAVRDRLGVANATPVDLLLGWLFFALILARCLMLTVNANRMRDRLANSRNRLTSALEQIRDMAIHDELTGTLNRRALLARLEQERGRAERAGKPFCVAMLDLDRFKSVNDNWGHAAGDAVLKAFTEIVRSTKRATDEFGRYGGEEFLLILVDIPVARAEWAVERVRAAVAAADWGKVAPGLSVTVSAGIAAYRKEETIEELVQRADTALYAAKHAGRNRVMVEP
jgi:diguanylate cyclase (GGDEF)-like protein